MRRFGEHPFGKQLEGTKEIFDDLDKDKDGRLTFEEFSAIMNRGLYQWPDKLSIQRANQ